MLHTHDGGTNGNKNIVNQNMHWLNQPITDYDILVTQECVRSMNGVVAHSDCAHLQINHSLLHFNLFTKKKKNLQEKK